MATRLFHVVFRAKPRHAASNSGLGKVSLTRVELYISFCVACHTCVQLVGSTYLNAGEVIAGECVYLPLIMFCLLG
jgi:hypothetical protein